MSKASVYARNLMANWLGFLANAVVMFFMTPFVVHTLGDARYGILTLLFSAAGHFGLADIGVRLSIGRHVNFYMARGEPEKVNGIVNTGMVFFLVTSPLLLVAAAAIGAGFEQFFPRVHWSYPHEASLILAMLGADMTLTMLASAAWTVVAARERFGLRNAAGIVVLLLRTAGIATALLAGRGLTTLAAVSMAAAALDLALSLPAAWIVDRQLRFGFQHCSRQRLRELLTFGVGAFFDGISQRFINFVDVFVIAWLLGDAQVTLYSLGMMFVQYGRGLLYEVVRTLEPDIAKRAAHPEPAAIHHLTARSVRVIMLFAVPLMAGFMTLGRDFIVRWMNNPAYARSATILLILAAGQVVAMSSAAWRSMLNSLGRVWLVSTIASAEAVVNFALSVALVRLAGWGIEGVAVGTLIPSVVFMGIVLPVVGARATRMPLSSFLTSVTAKWAVGLGLCVIVGLGVAHLPLPPTWPGVLAKVALAGVAMAGVSWMVVTSADDRRAMWGVLKRIAGRFAPPIESEGETPLDRAPGVPVAPADFEAIGHNDQGRAPTPP